MLPDLTTLSDFRNALAQAPGADADARAACEDRNGQLTKPPGALGQLEEIAIWYGSWRGTARPEVRAPQVIVFAGNHGVTARGVSAFPAEVTVQMVANFKAGGAAINQLAQLADARMDVHALELDRPTADFTQGPAMSEEDLLAALRTGWNAVDPASDVLVVGEMGIGNTTSAAAICHALYGGEPGDWTGRGTGVDDEGLALKTAVIAEAVALHGSRDGLEVLRCLGGREIAAMAGAIAAARVLRIPVILDGFICCAAAASLARLHDQALDHAVAGHQSAEGGHQALLARLGKAPLLSLGLRLGEGSGAALAIQVLKGALACHSGMATFAEAGVSDG
ncbi:Nicotinate-nucleotide-dimethylbenzimidazole phosphoribosyltransferase [Ruegeria sp. TM1040]|uniref:Nicotinate-nucleotide--dimethylbenzimidazole phosphoribosyltransferase n=1 Tax=Ruegeria sp. (strain TM1040) TaxID=292414 RepID=COBT_RUEST|nr:nicotinate-nucleotide--dimethylbenzimidazole phosphoribosyltransferase [Ruegeria sp. TM1040]Q1GJ55.1 RecName: Full=Nicotinate-nucleotide--dimethylbenzimidazole phosphoribosyltransferase; Short=NN:DBI PRT; AltName: Full=N(1)-alpha-phosphoribosyltransferase [Ruegeria sp. TM1040]ABF63311.1 Nicotinate-nucleotide-dimethylbenzimidazole phosphoribosyltransferase [Ruegeria sp. TM1040]